MEDVGLIGYNDIARVRGYVNLFFLYGGGRLCKLKPCERRVGEGHAPLFT